MGGGCKAEGWGDELKRIKKLVTPIPEDTQAQSYRLFKSLVAGVLKFAKIAVFSYTNFMNSSQVYLFELIFKG
jgi:hypothetical protein